MNDYASILYRPGFHAAYFTYHGMRYSFAGWWCLDWDDGYKLYDSIEDFLRDPFFDGKRFEEVKEQLIDFDYDLSP